MEDMMKHVGVIGRLATGLDQEQRELASEIAWELQIDVRLVRVRMRGGTIRDVPTRKAIDRALSLRGWVRPQSEAA